MKCRPRTQGCRDCGKMRTVGFVSICVMLLATAASCGESAQEKQARLEAEQRHKADSIAQVEAQAQAEQHRQDSIASALKKAERIAADSTVRAELLPAFIEVKNADASGASAYQVKKAPKGHQQNSAYLSFTVDAGRARELLINVCYYGQNWLSIVRASVTIDDGDPEQLSLPSEISNYINDRAWCSEWFAASVYSGLADKLLEAKKVTVTLKGEERDKVITLSPDQVSDMQKTIKLFKAFGG